MRSGSPPPASPRRLAAVIPVVALLGLLLFLAAHRHARQLTSRLGGVPSSSVHAANGSTVPFVPAASLATIAVVLGVIGLVVLRSRISRWRRHQPFGHLDGRDHEGEWPSGENGSLAQSIGEVRVADPEEEPDPRRAVVAAYLAMTHAAGEVGAVRRVDETPSEFLVRLLGAAGASADAAAHLTAVFELARYTTRPVDESLRSSAISALHRVRSELGVGV